jgi:hypothetical protein
LLFVGWFGVVSSLSLSTPLTTEEEKKNKKMKKKNFLFDVGLHENALPPTEFRP